MGDLCDKIESRKNTGNIFGLMTYVRVRQGSQSSSRANWFWFTCPLHKLVNFRITVYVEMHFLCGTIFASHEIIDNTLALSNCTSVLVAVGFISVNSILFRIDNDFDWTDTSDSYHWTYWITKGQCFKSAQSFLETISIVVLCVILHGFCMAGGCACQPIRSHVRKLSIDNSKVR